MSAGVLIIGAGLAAQRCCEALRSRGWDGALRVVGDEAHRPYDRPPLSKALLAGRASVDDLALRPSQWYADHDVELTLDTRASALDPAAREVVLADHSRLAYETLVVATGGVPRTFPGLHGRGNVHVLRTVDDAVALRAALRPGTRLAVVGAGLIGLEVASTARSLGVEVIVVEAAAAPLAGVLGRQAGAWLADLHAAAGVEILCDTRIEAVHGTSSAATLVVSGGRRIACDAIVVAVGMAPATEWLATCGLPRGRLTTDARGRTALPHVFAAGDAAGAGHWEAAARDGAVVAAGILGAPQPPTPVPSFWSDQHGVRLQFAGTAAGHDRLEVDGDPTRGDARLLFLRGEAPTGGLLLGRPRELPALRRMLRDNDTERNAA